MSAFVEYGLTTTVLATGWRTEHFRRTVADWPEPKLRLWWQRTDYAWRCSLHPRSAGVMYKTLDAANKAAEKHATEHPGITVKEI